MAKDIYAVLSDAHAAAKKLLDKLAQSPQEDARLRRDKGIEVAAELISRNEAESGVLYRRLMKFDDLRGHVERHQSEYREANWELRYLMRMDVEDSACLGQKIRAVIEERIADTEGWPFSRARRHRDDHEAKALAEEFKREQARQKESLKAA